MNTPAIFQTLQAALERHSVDLSLSLILTEHRISSRGQALSFPSCYVPPVLNKPALQQASCHFLTFSPLGPLGNSEAFLQNKKTFSHYYSFFTCIMNQHDALFILTLLHYHASTGFGPICSPSSGSSKCICGKWLLFFF
jgi:hypothetical protein